MKVLQFSGNAGRLNDTVTMIVLRQPGKGTVCPMFFVTKFDLRIVNGRASPIIAPGLLRRVVPSVTIGVEASMHV
jgi:hypothetical protein